MDLQEWFQHFILTYGYPALFIGSILEGDTFVVVAAILAARGYLSLPMVIGVAFLGTFAADQFFFTLGKTQGRAFLDKRPSWQPGVEKVKTLSQGHGLNAATGEYEDLVAAGVIDPAKVTRSALQNAASIAALFLTTEAVIADKPEKEKAGDAAGGMGGMEGMM